MLPKVKVSICVSVILLGFMVWPETISALPSRQIYDSVTVEMHVLTAAGDWTEALCTSSPEARQSYGCTARVDDLAHLYPFGDNSMVAVSIESHVTQGAQQGYLHNIVPVEIALTVSSQGNKPISSVEAQAIAARTYTYYHITANSIINNSNEYHVYVPYTYDLLNSEQQYIVDRAVLDRVYLTTLDSVDAILAQYGADNAGRTTEGNKSYLKSVADPISEPYGAPMGAGYGGMSSRGASRWGFGHTSSRGPVSKNNPLYPHDNQGDGDFWSVRYDSSYQILAHYYTGIHVRDANQNVLTPPERWNPLKIKGVSSVIDLDAPPTIAVQVQNTGVQTWACNTAPGEQDYYTLHAKLELLGQTTQTEAGDVATDRGNVCGLGPGQDLTTTVTIDNLAAIPRDGGMYWLVFDVFYDTAYGGPYYWFSGQGALNWPAYEMVVCVERCAWIFLPLISLDSGYGLGK